MWDIINEAGLYRLRGHKGNITQARFLHSHNLLITRYGHVLYLLREDGQGDVGGGGCGLTQKHYHTGQISTLAQPTHHKVWTCTY